MLVLLIAVSVWLAAAIAPAAQADVFPAIPEVRAEHGVARVSFDVVIDPTTAFPAFAWNGHLGEVPTIRVAPGDAIDMTVHNAMRPFPGRPDNVNVHFHGLVVSPHAPGDDVLTTLARPGETVQYHVVIPRDHEPGLYWYHPHAHGETYYDVTNGMSGAIVIAGLRHHLPALAGLRERVIVLRDVPTGPGFVDDDMPVAPMTGMHDMPGMRTIAASQATTARRVAPRNPCRPENGLLPTLNRQIDAHIAFHPGERQLFRVVNASAARYFDLAVDGADLQLVALDGFPLDAYPGTPAMRAVSHLRIPPAGRAEFVVTVHRLPTVLRSACVDTGPAGDAAPAAVLAHFVDPAGVRGPGGADAAAGATPSRVGAPLPRNVFSRPLPRPAAERTIRFAEDDRGFYINGKAFDMHDPPSIVARSGTVEEWTIVNATDELHDFHMHQVHFVLDSINGVAVHPRTWLDTADVPPQRHLRDGRSVPGRILVVLDFRDPVIRGTFIYHCHILDHEDRGMMAKIEVR